jgi:hypothetical protein
MEGNMHSKWIWRPVKKTTFWLVMFFFVCIFADGVDFSGTWEKKKSKTKAVFDQKGRKITGYFESAGGSTWQIKGTVGNNGVISLIRYIPKSELIGNGLPESDFAFIFSKFPSDKEGYLKGVVELKYNANDDELIGYYTTHTTIRDSKTRKLEKVLEVKNQLILVRVNHALVDLRLGAESKSDKSLNDDWVGADGHRILNFVKVYGPPDKTVDIMLDYKTRSDKEAGYNQPSTASITINPTKLKVKTDSKGISTSHFEIKGGTHSEFTEDIIVRAKVGGKIVDKETLTVLKFNFEEKTDGKGHTPLNPAVVNSFEHKHGGNLFGTTARTTGNFPISDFGFTLPSLSGSPKINRDKIEVLWGRKVNGQFKDSDQDQGLVFKQKKATDRKPLEITNLRLWDKSLPRTIADNTVVTYYLGHRSSKHRIIPDLQKNNVGSIKAHVLPHLNFAVVAHILKGPTKNAGLTKAQVKSMMEDVNKIWSQAGVGFKVRNIILEKQTSDDLLDVTTSSKMGAGSGESGDVTDINPNGGKTPAAIDIYFVNTIYDSSSEGVNEDQLNGFTHLTTQKVHNPGCIIAGPSGGSWKRDIKTITRTLAHEIGHYLLDTSDHVPDNQLWNLMRSGGVSPNTNHTKRDITLEQARVVRNSDVTPTNADGKFFGGSGILPQSENYTEINAIKDARKEAEEKCKKKDYYVDPEKEIEIQNAFNKIKPIYEDIIKRYRKKKNKILKENITRSRYNELRAEYDEMRARQNELKKKKNLSDDERDEYNSMSPKINETRDTLKWWKQEILALSEIKRRFDDIKNNYQKTRKDKNSLRDNKAKYRKCLRDYLMTLARENGWNMKLVKTIHYDLFHQ